LSRCGRPRRFGASAILPLRHDGANLDLDSVIRRHGGEALDSRVAYTKASEDERRQLIAFLNNLVLYQTTSSRAICMAEAKSPRTTRSRA